MVYSKGDLTDMYEVEALLYVQEAVLDKYKKKLTTSSASANIAHGSFVQTHARNGYSRGRGRYTRGCEHGDRQNSTHTVGQQTTPDNIPTCQLRNKYEHSAIDCWHQFDERFVPTTTKSLAQGTPSTGPSDVQSSNAPAATTVEASTYVSHHEQLNITYDLEAQVWFADSGASHHMTSHSLHLQSYTSSVGPKKVIIGNGQCLEVKSIECSQFASNFMPNHL